MFAVTIDGMRRCCGERAPLKAPEIVARIVLFAIPALLVVGAAVAIIYGQVVLGACLAGGAGLMELVAGGGCLLSALRKKPTPLQQPAEPAAAAAVVEVPKNGPPLDPKKGVLVLDCWGRPPDPAYYKLKVGDTVRQLKEAVLADPVVQERFPDLAKHLAERNGRVDLSLVPLSLCDAEGNGLEDEHRFTAGDLGWAYYFNFGSEWKRDLKTLPKELWHKPAQEVNTDKGWQIQYVGRGDRCLQRDCLFKPIKVGDTVLSVKEKVVENYIRQSWEIWMARDMETVISRKGIEYLYGRFFISNGIAPIPPGLPSDYVIQSTDLDCLTYSFYIPFEDYR